MTIEKVLLPAMGEGIFEATITQWLVNEGDRVEEDDSLVEIATDKVDSEVPAPVSGVIKEILVKNNGVAKIGEPIVIIETENAENLSKETEEKKSIDTIKAEEQETPIVHQAESYIKPPLIPHKLSNGAFLSPLVRRIAEQENITENQLLEISGTGLSNRITKDDVLAYIEQVREGNSVKQTPSFDSSVEIIEMSRLRSLIAENMVKSKQTAPHVTSFHEVDVTNIVNWRNKVKNEFQKKYNQKLTFTPFFVEAVAMAIREFPLINVSVVGNQIHRKTEVNIGMATAMPDGNLIVPVIKNADALSLSGLAHQVNDLANRARNKQLKPDEIQGGTFTITNVGAFGNLSGTPIINQPEVAIIAVGAIKKRPAVVETSQGDMIAISHQMVLSLSYDHRVVDGSLGGLFLKKVADILEAFNQDRLI